VGAANAHGCHVLIYREYTRLNSIQHTKISSILFSSAWQQDSDLRLRHNLRQFSLDSPHTMADDSPCPSPTRRANAFFAEPTLPAPQAMSPVSKMPMGILSSSPMAGQKRPAASLLPAFEPLSSSPGLPRPAKRQSMGTGVRSRMQLPTPVPTSSTGILSSSPPRNQQSHVTRPPFVRTSTGAAKREPLSDLPTVVIPENGEWLTMGRSSNSSTYQLSSHRVVSRVHIKARYIPASGSEPARIEIHCEGWNGLKLNCRGRTTELLKGDCYTSEYEGFDILLDVQQEARVMLQWPKREAAQSAPSDGSSWDDSPPRSQALNRGVSESPLRRTMRLQSPASPTPRHLSSSQRLQALFPQRDSSADDEDIQIYEDEAEDELPPAGGPMDLNASMRTEATVSFSSDLSEPESDGEKDPDEENDPIVHSFGPFGADISGRFAAISAVSPRVRSPKSVRSPVKVNRSPVRFGSSFSGGIIPFEPLLKPAEVKQEAVPEPVKKPVWVPVDPVICNHVVNQLAWSRLSSTPLSTIMRNLPADSQVGLQKEALRMSIESMPAIGIIPRQGKDAAGKPLESEYYYLPEKDEDEERRAMVVDGLRKPSLRACRKQHKQYYWKRPRTP